jgi:pilus assembly protein TadC
MMTIVFLFAALCCTCLGVLVWFFPKALINFHDWLTEKTLLHDSKGVFYRIVIGAFFLGVGSIFWWVMLS